MLAYYGAQPSSSKAVATPKLRFVSQPLKIDLISVSLRYLAVLLFCATLVLSPCRAQVTSGSLAGIVSDPTGAVVPGAKVVLTDINKGYNYPTTTGATGSYLIPNLLPSTYKLTVENRGFKTFIQDGIFVDVGTRVQVDVRLELGATTQAVEVVGAAPLLATRDAVTGQEVDRASINDLPLYGRAVFDLAFLAPGMIQAPGATFGPENNGNNFVSNGGRNATAEVLIDGIAATSYEPNTGINTLLYTPSVDAVQEFKIMQNNYTAEEGFTGNTYINMVLRSGTNAFHGSAWEFVRNDKLDANNWFSNASNGKIPPLRQNQYGITFGGPIKKDKTFFFVDWEGTRSHTGATSFQGVPSANERTGDFGEICTNASQGNSSFDPKTGICNNGNYQLYDPYSGVYVAGTGRELQTPIPFNNLLKFQSAGNPKLSGTPYQLPAVPGNLIDPVAAKMIQYFPTANVNVGTSAYNPYNNWASSGFNASTNDQFDVRVDHRFSDRTTFNVRYSEALGTYENWISYGNALDPFSQGPGLGGSRSAAISLNHTFSPNTLLNVSLGFTRGLSDTQGIAKAFPSFDPVKNLGLPSYIETDGIIAAPVVEIGSGYAAQNGESLGPQAWSVYKNGNQVYHLLSTLTHMKGRHELKFGGEWRVNQMNWYQDGVPGGLEVYDQWSTSQYPWWGGGDAMASFLTGTGSPNTWGEYEVSPHFSTQNYRWGGFVQDNWRATDKLTVNVGLRYDLEIPRTERYNRMSYIDPTESIAIHPKAIDPTTWPSALGAVPNVTSPTGGLAFASNSQRHIVNTNYNNFGPRLGLAYKLHNSLVLRAGYGLFYDPTQWGTTGAGPVGNEGFEAVTNWLTTMNGDGVTPWGRLSDPYPGGPMLPTGSSLGNLTNLGLGINEPEQDANLSPYTQTWSAGVQYQLPGNWLIDMNYVGTKGTHLYYHGAGAMQYFGTWIEQEATNSALLTALGTYVPNPYYGVINTPGCGMCGPTIAAGHLALPFPQFSGVSQPNAPWSNSIYNAFQLKIEKRMSNGLAMLATYTNSKSIDDASVSTSTEWLGGFGALRDPNNLKLERSLSEWDIPQVFQFGYLWQIPFGKGKKWGGTWNSVVNGVLGGWQTNGIWRFDNGQPIHLGLSGGTAPWGYSALDPNQTGILTVNPKSKWFEPNGGGYFANAVSVLSMPALYTIGNASRMEPNVRLPGTKNAALSLFKEFSLNKLREGSRLEFRLEAFNALNHPQLGNVNTTFNSNVTAANPTASGFGDVQSQANSPREVQLALKLYF